MYKIKINVVMELGLFIVQVQYDVKLFNEVLDDDLIFELVMLEEVIVMYFEGVEFFVFLMIEVIIIKCNCIIYIIKVFG